MAQSRSPASDQASTIAQPSVACLATLHNRTCEESIRIQYKHRAKEMSLMTHDERFTVRFHQASTEEPNANGIAMEPEDHACCDHDRWMAWRGTRSLDTPASGRGGQHDSDL
jgi:hypothetical protein